MEEISLIIRFKNRTLTVREYIEFSKRILIKLENLHPIFQNLFGWGHDTNLFSNSKLDKNNFEEIVFHQINDKDVAYDNVDVNDKNMHWNSTSWIDFSNSYSNTKKSEEGQITVKISCGGTVSKTGSLIIDFPNYNYPEFKNYSFVSNLMKICIGFFDTVEYAVIISNLFRKKVRSEKTKMWIGWITYVPNISVFNMLPSFIHKEYINEGVLFSISETPPLIDNRDVEIAIGIRNELVMCGILS